MYVHQLRSRRKRERNLAGEKPVINKQTTQVKELGVSTLERAVNNTYTVGLEKTVFPEVLALKIKDSTTLNFAEQLNSEKRKDEEAVKLCS